MNARLPLLLALVAATLAGCSVEYVGPSACEWVTLKATPSTRNASYLDLHVVATNCGDAAARLESEGCVAMLELHPVTQLEGRPHYVGLPSAAPVDNVPCTPDPPLVGDVPPADGIELRTPWDGTVLGERGTRGPAPPGEYELTSRVFGHEASVRVTLNADRTFTVGGAA